MNGNPGSYDERSQQQPTPQQAFPPLPAAPASDPRSKSVPLACVLSAMPGLGQVYVGYYQRGFIHAITVASLITYLASGGWSELKPLAALFMAFFWLYNIIDAGRRASLYNQALTGSEQIEPPSDFKMPSVGGSIFGGLILMGFGFMLLLHTRFDMSLDWIEEWWPIGLMILGLYLLVRAVQERMSQSTPPARSSE